MKIYFLKKDKLPIPEAYLEPCQISKMEHFAEIVSDF